MKKAKLFRALIWFIAALLLSKFLVAAAYLGYRVIDASSKGMLPMDGVTLKADLDSVLADPTWSGLGTGALCLLFSLFLRRKVKVQVPQQPVKGMAYMHWGIFALAAGMLWRLTISFGYGFLIDWGLMSEADVMTQGVQMAQGDAAYIMQLLSVTLVIPAYEELYFRKLLVNDLLQAYSCKKAFGIALAAFIILHSGTNLLYAPAVGVAALYAYQRYGKILLCMLIHACFNLAGACNIPFVQQFPPIVYILYAMAAAVCIGYVVPFCRRRKAGKAEMNS